MHTGLYVRVCDPVFIESKIGLAFFPANQSSTAGNMLEQRNLLMILQATCESRNRCSGLRVDVVLERVRLSWDDHRDRLHQVLEWSISHSYCDSTCGHLDGVQLKQPEDFTGVDIDPPLGQHSKALLRSARDELTEVTHPRSLFDDLVVPHVAVPLARHVDHLRVRVIVRRKHSAGRVDCLDLQGLLQVLLAPDSILSVRVF